MSIHRFVTICCDSCYTHTTPFRTSEEVSAATAEQGWFHDADFDEHHCPSCLVAAVEAPVARPTFNVFEAIGQSKPRAAAPVAPKGES